MRTGEEEEGAEGVRRVKALEVAVEQTLRTKKELDQLAEKEKQIKKLKKSLKP
jgi:hypothetical protein